MTKTNAQETFEVIDQTTNKVIQFDPSKYHWLKDTSKRTQVPIDALVDAAIGLLQTDETQAVMKAMKASLERQLKALESLDI
jgi:hypothetical protein